MTRNEFFTLLKNHPHLDAEVLARAYAMAEKAHAGQKREVGTSYITHPTAVAAALVEIGMDTQTIAAALLHDVVEDTPVTPEDVKKAFGEEVAFFVEGVTKLEKLPLGSGTASSVDAEKLAIKMETIRKMFFATAQDIRVALIKLADRLHNMQTLDIFSPEKRHRIAQETMDIYAPLAGRLGMGEWKGQLEDLAFPHLYPKEYEWLTQRMDKAYLEREIYIQKIVPLVRSYLAEEGIEPVELHARPKHHWSLYQKLLAHEMDLAKIYDLVALRIIVKNIEECYRTLGVLHKHFTPLPGRIRDYIALPKGSGYQSLHTTVFCVDGRITEFQVRTYEMHAEAEFGIAAHFQYKELGKESNWYKGIRAPSVGKKLKWIEQIQEWQKAAKGTKEFMDALKLEFLKRRIFVFTPKGDIIDLPAGACAIDYAYAIHSEIGHRCAGAKADGRIVPLSEPLANGMLVEVMTRKDPEPKRDWLQIAKTAEAKKKILAWFKRHEAKNAAQKSGPENEHAEEKDAEPEPQIKIKRPSTPRTDAVVAEGVKGIATRLAKCCAPLPGDDIEGYVSVLGGISIHKAGCVNLKKARDVRRRIPVAWEAKSTAPHPATIKVRSQTRVGLLRDVSEVISKSGLNILSLTAYDTPDGEAVQIITVEVKNAEELAELSGKIKSVKSVFSVERV